MATRETILSALIDLNKSALGIEPCLSDMIPLCSYHCLQNDQGICRMTGKKTPELCEPFIKNVFYELNLGVIK